MKKILHLSDLHIGFGDLSVSFQRIVRNIVFLKEPASNYVVVITGDLVETAFDNKNFAEARAHLAVLEEAGFKVLVVPGNHDYGMGSLALRKYVKEFKKVFFGTANLAYPKLDVVGEIAFIGLDSMAEEVHWYDSLWANGELGRKQLDRLKALLGSPEVGGCERRVVYLHHHPFDPLAPMHELKDAEKLQQVLESSPVSIDALLFGHNHHAGIRNGKWGIPRCYDAGTSTRKLGSPGPHRVIDLSRDPRQDYDGDFH